MVLSFTSVHAYHGSKGLPLSPQQPTCWWQGHWQLASPLQPDTAAACSHAALQYHDCRHQEVTLGLSMQHDPLQPLQEHAPHMHLGQGAAQGGQAADILHLQRPDSDLSECAASTLMVLQRHRRWPSTHMPWGPSGSGWPVSMARRPCWLMAAFQACWPTP